MATTRKRTKKPTIESKPSISFPTYVMIGAHKISIERDKAVLDAMSAWGVFYPSKLKILIHSEASDSLAYETLWHEVIEALNYLAEADMEHRTIQVFGLLLHQAAESMFGIGKDDA